MFPLKRAGGKEGRGEGKEEGEREEGKKFFMVKKASLTKQSKGHKMPSTVGTNQKSVE